MTQIRETVVVLPEYVLVNQASRKRNNNGANVLFEANDEGVLASPI
jgi:hypothetical protein